MKYNFDYERPFPIEDEQQITKAQHRYIEILAEWLKYKEETICVKVGEVLGKKISNLWELRNREADTIIKAWKKLKEDIQND